MKGLDVVGDAQMRNDISRRGLFSRLRGGPRQLRPPWALAEREFTEMCTQCGACTSACPTGLIRSGHAGYPIVDFSSSYCTFCGACARACRQGCFKSPRETEPWVLTAEIGAGCLEAGGVACRVCETACERDAIRFRPTRGGRSSVWIEDRACTGCGHCLASCPVHAIEISVPTAREVKQ